MTYLRLLGVWLLLALLMPLNGALREFGFKRVMSAPVAEWLSVLTGIAVILATTRWLFRVPADAPDGQLLLQALTLVTLTVAYEFGIGFAGGRTLAEMLQHYAIWRGQLWPLVLVALAVTPCNSGCGSQVGSPSPALRPSRAVFGRSLSGRLTHMMQLPASRSRVRVAAQPSLRTTVNAITLPRDGK